MRGRFMAFRKSRRSAVAMIFALSFLPLIYLVGLSVDYTFYSLGASQAQLAAQGAATNAVRAAISTYTLEIAGGVTASGPATPNAYADGVKAGQQAGYMWYIAQLGQLPRGSVSATGTSTSGSTATVSGYPIVTVGEPATGGGFVAQVKYNYTYPPLFNGLFKRTTSWVATGNTQATSNFDFAEILFLLDTSNSMLIGTDVNDELTMEYNDVCQGSTVFDTTVSTGQEYLTEGQYAYGTISNNGATDNDEVDFTKVANYTDPSGTKDDISGSCTKNNTPPVYGGVPLVTCALACHSSSSTASAAYGGYSMDLYGLARRIRANELAGNPPTWSGSASTSPYGTNASPYGTSPALSLRLDIVMDSAYTAIQDMVTEEGFTGQFTAGVYGFNKDVSAIAEGSATTPTPEATDLTTAGNAVLADDYIQTPTETSFPPVYNSGTRNTDFVTSMTHLRDGTATGGTAIGAVNSVTGGQAPSTPLKFLFIVTDGLEDPPGPPNKLGEMTSYNAENTSGDTNPAVCQPYKTLGFTIYVLAIQYYPLSSSNYYNQINVATAYTADDYPTQFSTTANTSPQDLATTVLTSGQSSPPNSSSYAPIDIGLRACASSTSDFFYATGASSINNAINTMLRSALASTIRLSN